MRLRFPSSMANTIQQQKHFLSFPYYAVVGASTDQSKFGTKVLQWYIQRNKPVTPVHPSNDELEGIKTIRSLIDLPKPTETSVSIITSAKITIDLLKQIKELSIPAVWCQPGATDVACVQYIKDNGMSDRVLFEGECILRDGDGVLQAML
ncbi:CoA binding domain-containing protein [Suillus paluster]|uniref:CoA binding domain-containing protein n=1 Tax=Suillus paluster TaxID=48578 RepID=UPI001B863779|nr:CoA binding domain-containing protein [Suillus paluster]KAG1725271.1 CoA binding domain-containing protein [Suillus paluster]